jgi:hypothetical protein
MATGSPCLIRRGASGLHPDLVALLFAANRLDASLVPLNWRLTAVELSRVLADAAPAMLLGEERCRATAEAAVQAAGLRDLAWFDLDADKPSGYRRRGDWAIGTSPSSPHHCSIRRAGGRSSCRCSTVEGGSSCSMASSRIACSPQCAPRPSRWRLECRRSSNCCVRLEHGGSHSLRCAGGCRGARRVPPGCTTRSGRLGIAFGAVAVRWRFQRAGVHGGGHHERRLVAHGRRGAARGRWHLPHLRAAKGDVHFWWAARLSWRGRVGAAGVSWCHRGVGVRRTRSIVGRGGIRGGGARAGEARISADEILREAREHLAAHKVPRALRFAAASDSTCRRLWCRARALASIPIMSSSPKRVGRPTPGRSTPAVPAVVQIDLFPERPSVERLDPRANVGPRTGVEDLVRVRLRAVEAPHLVFHDRHGWYCEAHGAGCPAVAVARAEDHDA